MTFLSAIRTVGPAVLTVSLLVGCGGDATPPGPTAAPRSSEVGKTITVGWEPWPAVVEVQGSLYADEQAVVGAKVAGPVETVAVDLGAPVKKGEILATLVQETFDLRVLHAEAQVASIRAKLGLNPGQDDATLDPMQAPTVRQERVVRDNARDKMERGRGLLARGAIGTEEVFDLEAAWRVAEAKFESALNLVEEQIAQLGVMKQELAQARQAREDATTRAPFDGLVQRRFAAPGVYLPVGAPVVALVRTDPLRYRAGVPESEALNIALNQTVRLSLRGWSEPISGKVTRIAPALETDSRALTFEADIPNPGGKLRSGLFARGTVIVDPDARSLAVPLRAVTTFAGVEKVWKVTNGKPAEVRIRTGRRDDDRVEVFEGLNPGDVILAYPER